MHIVSVVGARPQFIKAAVVSRALAATGTIRESLLHSGQHYDEGMSGQFFAELEIPEPTWNLGIGSGSHGQQTGRMLEAMEQVLLEARPDWVIVYGDTNSTLAGALAAAKLGIPIAHVEAGLRSFNRAMPEEINRILTDHLSTLLFAPTAVAMGHLEQEGIARSHCHLVGDVMYDSVRQLGPVAAAKSSVLARESLVRKGYVLATIHRAENTTSAAQLVEILRGLEEAGRDCPVVLPLHPRAGALLDGTKFAQGPGTGLRLIEPQGYLDMLALEEGARLVVTDSGGVQKEAFFQRVPCLTLRAETEWTELVAAGWNHLGPPVSAEVVREAVRQALGAPLPAEPAGALYGGGVAGEAIAAVLAG
ncbi:MAG: UDP-N-acetylglucosamine 2-epimerase (non-hydrolyzing) [Gemmatimonadales bacterium]|nr:UDP-N-acetylglucosamine 2-epimerase (non-hydrolyzing) [Gemmatimonadales bacterium]